MSSMWLRCPVQMTACSLLIAASTLRAQQPIDEVEVVGTTPLGGALDADKVAANAQRATAEQMRDSAALDLADFMKRALGGVFVNAAQSNPLQPDIQYRGFVGSPLLGLPQGLAVYQDAVRINEPFGDTVNWALIPESAIDTVYLMPGSSPLFGLNALGGAISIRTKDGFAYPGSRAELSGGSFSRFNVQAETGGSIDDRFGYFVTASRLEEDGWRDFSPTEAAQFFGSLGWRGGRTSVDADLTRVDTDLVGNGAAPVQLLDIDRSAIFTRPDQTRNRLTLFNVTADHAFSAALTLRGNVYLRRSDIGTFNGDDSDFDECEDLSGFICQEDGGEQRLVTDENGGLIPADESLEGATVNRTKTEQDGAGFSAQASWSGDVAGHTNQLIVGAAYDRSDIAFRASTELGSLDASRLAVPGGAFVGDAFTRMIAETSNAGYYVADTLSLSRRVALTLSGRYNRTEVVLRDQLGTALDGDHEFDRFNPAAGLTFALSDDLTFYASYGESNRTPSPVELTCADVGDPCRLPNAFIADPPLDQVVAKTVELGFRGRSERNSWHAGLFSTVNHDDILFISAGELTNQGFFDNVGRTQRNGIELSFNGEAGERLTWFVHYTFLDATFRDAITMPSVNNPLAVDGEIFVARGDRLPLIPRRLLKAGVQFDATPKLRLGGELFASSSLYLRGDEANLVDQADGYAVVNLHGEYRINDVTRIFASVDNVFDRNYETFGVFGEPDEVLGDAFDDSRYLSPGAPRAAWIGLRFSF